MTAAASPSATELARIAHARRAHGPGMPSAGRWLLRALLACVAAAALAVAALRAALSAEGPVWGREVASIPARVHAELAAQSAPYTPLAAVAPTVPEALVAIEDRRFYQHHGVDPVALARTVANDVRTGQLVAGGATLDIQLVERTLDLQPRNVPNALRILGLAWTLEDHFGKSRILELYLNDVYFGRNAYGIGAASEVYFREAPARLDVAHAAFLASLVQAPSAFGADPYSAAFRYRWRTTIQDLASQGYITAQQARAAGQESVRLAPWAGSGARTDSAVSA